MIYLYRFVGIMFFVVVIISCGTTQSQPVVEQNNAGTTIITRFNCPTTFVRVESSPSSFAHYLQNLPLKAVNTPVKTYTGDISYQNEYAAGVVDFTLGKQDLQQCADAVMRLRAEYLFRQKRYDDIKFHFVSGFLCDWKHYKQGYRFVNNQWQLKGGADESYKTFQQYLNLVYTFASTLSLQKELLYVGNISTVSIGDVFIKGGSPGHCFIVVDVVKNPTTQAVKVMLAQSFMPAQDIQIMKSEQTVWIDTQQKPDFPYSELIDSKFHYRFP